MSTVVETDSKLTVAEGESVGPEIFDLSTFTEAPFLEADQPYLIQLKGFNRFDRMERRVAQHENEMVPTDQPEISRGALIIMPHLSHKSIISEQAAIWSYKLPDTRGVAMTTDYLYAGSVDHVYAFDLRSHDVRTLTHPWFGFIHGLGISPSQTRLAVASSGYDRIIELDLSTGKETSQWFAREHGFRTTPSGKDVSHKPAPVTNRGLGFPKESRTAFPNSVTYISEHTILATLYHRGLIRINLDTKQTDVLNTDLFHPHAIFSTTDGFVVTNSAVGTAVLLDKDFNHQGTIDFRGQSGLDSHAEGLEWVQYVRPIAENKFIAVDSHRATISIIDLATRQIHRVPYDPDWVIQEIVPIPSDTLRSLSG